MTGKDPRSNNTLAELVDAINISDDDPVPGGCDARWNAERGGLIHSYAENLIQSGKLESARYELAKWVPLDATSPSSMERIVSRSFKSSLGRTLIFQGYFQEALNLLLPTLQESDTDDFFEGTGWRLVLLSNIGDIYIELDRAAEAEEIISPESKKMVQAGAQNISSGRRLQLVLAESFIRRAMYHRAEEVALNLKTILEAITDPDMFAKRGIFRVLNMLARIAHFRSRWIEALELWDQTKKALEVLGRQDHSQMGLVQYAIAYALMKIGKLPESLQAFGKGKSMLEGQERRHWIVGFESYWHDYIVECVNLEVASLRTV